jgi:ADP-ribose pyrophosphatase
MTDADLQYEGKFISVLKRGGWEYVERNNADGAVLVVAVTPDCSIILVEQHRIPMDCKVIEMPAGIRDVEGEPPETTVRRELEEETGYKAEHVFFLCGGPNSPGLTNECAWMYAAVGLTRVGPGGGDSNENITVHEVKLDRIDDWLRRKEIEGVMIDPKIYAALFFAKGIDA